VKFIGWWLLAILPWLIACVVTDAGELVGIVGGGYVGVCAYWFADWRTA